MKILKYAVVASVVHILSGCSVNTAAMSNNELATCATTSKLSKNANACYEEQVRRGVFKAPPTTTSAYHQPSINYVNQNIGLGWIEFDTKSYFKKESSTNETITGWVKMVRPQKGGVHHTVDETEINCKNKTTQSLMTVLYRKDGTIINESDSLMAPTSIIPDSVGEALYEVACSS